jgi:hypothetical protein
LIILAGGINTGSGGGLLRQQFAELAQFEQTRIRIVSEIALGDRPQHSQIGLQTGQMSKVRALSQTSG